MASPHAAGAAALVMSVDVVDANGNGRTNDEVRAILARSADDLGAAGRDTFYGWGLVNVARAALACKGDVEPDGDVDGSDLAKFLGHFASGSTAGDLNADHAVDEGDLLILLNNFGHNGCAN